MWSEYDSTCAYQFKARDLRTFVSLVWSVYFGQSTLVTEFSYHLAALKAELMKFV